ncbi:MAG: TolC family protein, partial [Terracidiphilus sp.]
MKGRVQLVAALLMLWTLSVAADAEQGNQPAPYRLTLQEAIQKGLQANLSVLLSGARVDGAAGTRIRRLSAALLPRVNAQTYANYQNRNLRAFGFSLPGIPEVIGPFSNYDIRLYAQQNLIDLHSLNLLRASTHDVEADKMDDRDARDLIVRAVAALYLNGESAQARVDA